MNLFLFSILYFVQRAFYRRFVHCPLLRARTRTLIGTRWTYFHISVCLSAEGISSCSESKCNVFLCQKSPTLYSMRTKLSSKNCVTSPLTQASADWLKTRARTTLPSSRKCDSSCDDCANAIENCKSIVTIVRASKHWLASAVNPTDGTWQGFCTRYRQGLGRIL